MTQDNIMEGSLKYRDGKKWKLRWAVLNKLSPVADVLQLHLYRDSRDRARGAPTKASLALRNSLALTTGFTLDKESHTMGLLCKDLSLVLAFDSRDRLLQWHSKLSATLGHEEQFLVQVAHVPPKSRVPLGPCRVHVRDHRICITSGIPPRLLEAWALMDLRRYGVVDGRFVWEGGTKSGRGSGVHVVLSDAGNEMTRAIDLASRGALTTKHRRISATKPSSGAIQRDAAMWLRDVGALDICHLSELCETVSIMASETGTIFSPRSECALDRRPCDTNDSAYKNGTSGGSSSSGSMGEGESGWWANTWASGKSSLWDVGRSSMAESLYDSPRTLPHTLTSASVCQFHQNNHQLGNSQLRNSINASTNSRTTIRQQHFPYVTPNPMDNYDVPKSHFQHYDFPKKYSSCIKNENVQLSGNFPFSTPSSQSYGNCSGIFCWPSSFICRKNNISVDTEENVRVNGQSVRPILDENSLTLLRSERLICYQESSSEHDKCGCTNSLDETTRKMYNSSNTCNNCKFRQNDISDSPIYAVIDKSKKVSKVRATSPISPHILEDKTPTNPNPNYANMLFIEHNSLSKSNDTEEHCGMCGGVKINSEDSKETFTFLHTNKCSISSRPHEPKFRNCRDETEYLMMGPREVHEDHSHYLIMKRPENYFNCSEKSLVFRPGRSLSLARDNQYTDGSLRKSTSADSILQDPFHSSQLVTPDITPYASPLHSPTKSPLSATFRTSTPCFESNRCVRGRPRKKIIYEQKSLPPFSDNCNVNDDFRLNFKMNESLGNNLKLSMSSSLPSAVTNMNTSAPDKEVHSCVQDILSCSKKRTVDYFVIANGVDGPVVRRSSSAPDKGVSRDSASSFDSGVCDSPKPNERIFLSHCLHSSLPRGPKDKVISSQLTEGVSGSCRDLGGAASSGDAKSSSSGTSDISDYLDTLSLSSHSSADHDRLLARSCVTTLRPRFGREYSRFDRTVWEPPGLAPVGEITSATSVRNINNGNRNN